MKSASRLTTKGRGGGAVRLTTFEASGSIDALYGCLKDLPRDPLAEIEADHQAEIEADERWQR